MLVEAGHFALALALGLSLIQFAVPLWGTRTDDPVLIGVAPPTALAVLGCIGFAFFALTYCLRDLGLLGPQRRRELALDEALHLQADGRVGEPRRLDAAVGPHPCRLRRRRRHVAQQRSPAPARQYAQPCRRRSSSPSCSSSSSPRTRSRALPRRRSKDRTSTRSCRIPASPSIRRFSMSAMSASRSRSPSRWRRSSTGASTRYGRAPCGRGR